MAEIEMYHICWR